MIKGKSVIEGQIFVSTKEVGGCLSVCILKKKSMQRNNTITIMQCYSRKSTQRLSCLCEKKSLKKNFKVILCPQLHCT